MLSTNTKGGDLTPTPNVQKWTIPAVAKFVNFEPHSLCQIDSGVEDFLIEVWSVQMRLASRPARMRHAERTAGQYRSLPSHGPRNGQQAEPESPADSARCRLMLALLP